MSNTVELKAVLTAQDNATGKINNFNSSLGKMAGAVGIGTLAADAFKKGISLLSGVVTDSVNEFIQEEAAIARLRAGMKNTTPEWQKGTDALIKQASALQNVTTFADENIISGQAMLSTFMLNSDQIAQLTPSLLDMASALEKTGGSEADLQNISIQLGKAIGGEDVAGLAGSLRRAGVVMTEAQTEILKTGKMEEKLAVITEVVSQNFGGFAAEAADTYGGRLKLLNNKVSDLEEVLGQAILQGISPYVDSLTDTVTRSNDTVGATEDLALTVYSLVGAVKVLANSLGVGGKIMSVMAGSAESLYKGMIADVTGTDAARKSADLANDSLIRLTQGLANSGQAVSDSFQQMMGKGYVPATQAITELNTATKNYIPTAIDSGKVSKEVADQIEKQAETMEKAKQATEDFRIKVIELGLDSKKAFSEMQADIKSKLIDELKKFSAEKEALVDATNKSIATVIVENESNLAKLEAQLAAEQDVEKKAQLQEQINVIKAFLDKHKQDYVTYAEEIKAVRSYYAMDEIEKIKFEHKEKLALIKEQHKENVKNIKDNIIETQKAVADGFTKMFTDLVKSNEMTLIKDLMAEALKFDITIDRRKFMEELGYTYAKSMADVSAAQKAGKEIKQVDGSYYYRQMGGSVNAGTPYIVGEAGPEMFVPNQSGNIVPNNKLGGGITLNISGNSFGNRSDIDYMITQIKRALNRDLSLEGLRV